MVGPRFELAEPKAFVWIVPFAFVDWNEWRQDLEFLEPIQIGTFPKTFAFAIAIPRVLLAHFLLALPVPRPWALPLPCKARSPWLPSRSALPPTFALACWACYLGCLWLPLPSWKGLGWRGKPLASIDTAIHHCCSASAFCLFQDSLAVMQPSPRVGPFSSRYL